MTWVTWRQHRVEFLAAALLAILILAVLLFSGQDLAARAQHADFSDMRYYLEVAYTPLLIFIRLLPLLLGVFVGAPLVANELEHGTHRLAWTQSITRERWFAVKLGWVGGMTALVFALLALAMTRWSQPIQAVLGPWNTFDVTGSVPIAYALFALALGILLGALFGKVLPAMALSLPLFGILRVAETYLLRPYFLPQLQATWNLTGPDPQLKDLVIWQWFVDRLGNRVPGYLFTSCFQVQVAGAKETPLQCVRDLGYQYLRIYQPAGRFWTFQAIETGLFLILALVLVALAFWWIRRRVY